MDPLSDVLSTLRLTSALYCRSELTAPWGMQFPARKVATFHAVRRGNCWLRFADKTPPLALSAGDFVVFPSGGSHIVSDELRRRPEDIESIIALIPESGPLVYGGGGAPTTLLCGHFRFSTGDVHPLLSIMPAFLHIPGDDGRASSQFESTLELLAREAVQSRPGSAAVIERASDILFVQLIRAYLEQPNTNQQEGWLRGLKDPAIARSIAAMHQGPERDWNVESLAAQAGMSRSAFCGRFSELVGEAPHRYLTRWRMHCASVLLRGQPLALKTIAERVGFGDEVAFSKAFKRHVGVPPAAYRRAALSSALT
jgi:AraC-like DNA-binding protein